MEMLSLNRYQYEPLRAEDDTRFIVLQPAKSSEEALSCSIVQCRRSEKNFEYSAVSYSWSEQELNEKLEIKHDSDTSYLEITPNVRDLLRCLRARRDVQNHLWIDAVCINQVDKDEKAQQIPVMGRIVQETKMVHIWLGHSNSVTGEVFEFIRKANRLREVGKVEMSRQMAKLLKKVFGDELRGYQQFFGFSDISWFSRRWIIQEACLAQDAIIHCGNHSMRLSLFVLAATRFQTFDIASYPIKVMAKLHRPKSKLTILELLWNFYETRCLLPEDRIAALYGLVSEEYRIHLDFTAEWTELYKQVVIGMLKIGNNGTRLQVLYHLLEFGSVSHPRDVFYPSWIPNWRQSQRRLLPYNSEIRSPDTYESYPASPGHSEKATLVFQHDTLQIHWPALSNRLRARRVNYVTNFESDSNNEYKNEANVQKIMDELFINKSSSTIQLFVIYWLIKKILKYCDTNQSSIQPWPTRSVIDRYIKIVNSNEQQKSPETRKFNLKKTRLISTRVQYIQTRVNRVGG